MPLPLYMDVHVPAAITAGLRRRRIEEDGSDRWPDELLLERATDLGRILFSQDDDLLAVAAQWQQQGKRSAGVIYAHQMSAGIGTLVNDLEIVLSCCTALDLADRVTYLPLR
jgi:hypothetical protein